MKTKELILQSERNRKRLIEIIYKAKAGHIGGDLSCLNVLTALYFDVMNVDAGNPKDNLRDRFILSKGHCVEALYVTLESRGFMAKGILDTLGQYGSMRCSPHRHERPDSSLANFAQRTSHAQIRLCHFPRQ